MTQKSLLVGFNKKTNLLKESTENNGKETYLTGIFQTFDEENQNGRIYPRAVLEPEVYRYKEEFVDTGRGFGEINHPSDDRADISCDRICHRVVDLWIEGNNVMGKTLILDTAFGKDIKAIVNSGGVLGVSSRSLGETDSQNRVKDLYIICWDIVSDPSVAKALMTTINECKKYDLEEVKRQNKRIDEMLKEAQIDSTINIEEERRKILYELRKFLGK
jgi:hypothetical protein